MLVLAYWLLRWQGRLWRRAIWAESGGSLESLARALDGEVRPGWMGWRVQGRAARVVVRGGLHGIRTRVRVGDRVVLDRMELPQLQDVLSALQEGGGDL